MGKTFCRIVVLVLLCAQAVAEIRTVPLFIIERSTNANVVHYDARLAADGKLDPSEPVIAYWVMKAEDGRRQKLNWIENNKAYGFTIRQEPSVTGLTMTVVSAPEHEITVKTEKDAIRAEAVIAGRPAIMEKMFIDVSEGFFGPSVKYIELIGVDPKTGEKVREKIVPK